MNYDLEKVKGAYKEMQELGDKFGWWNFEIALLITLRLDNVINSEEEITERVADKVNEIADSRDSILDEDIIYSLNANDSIDELFDDDDEDEDDDIDDFNY